MGIRKQFEGLYLSREDLIRLRQVRALGEVAQSGNPNMTVDRAQRCIMEDAGIIAELREKYKIPYDESVGFSLIDGMILDMDEEA